MTICGEQCNAETMSAVVKLAGVIDESASDVVRLRHAMTSACDSVWRAMLSSLSLSLSRPADGDAHDSHDQSIDGCCDAAMMMLAGEIDDVFLRHGVKSHALLSLLSVECWLCGMERHPVRGVVLSRCSCPSRSPFRTRSSRIGACVRRARVDETSVQFEFFGFEDGCVPCRSWFETCSRLECWRRLGAKAYFRKIVRRRSFSASFFHDADLKELTE